MTTTPTKSHYVYRISNTKSGMHYYGSRSTSLLPSEDLGIRYFSSSTCTWFKTDQQETPQDYRYKIIKTFVSRDAAIEFECMLHLKFNVSSHPQFVNLANQITTGFSAYGRVNVLDTRNGKSTSVTREEYDANEYYVSHTTGHVTVLDIRDESIIRVTKADYRKFDYYVSPNKGKVAVVDTRYNTYKYVTTTEFYAHDYYVSRTKGKVNVVDIRDNTSKRVTKNEFYAHDYYTHSRAKKIIIIYNAKGDIMFETYGNFKQVCNEHNLPNRMLGDSYRNNGSPIYTAINKSTLQRLVNTNMDQYIGWYARFFEHQFR